MARRLNEDYNGWKNWETWYASMILGDADSYVKDLAEESDYDTYDFSDSLKSFFMSWVFEDEYDSIPQLVREYAEYGLEQIDFYELAETFLMDIEPNDEDEYEEY